MFVLSPSPIWFLARQCPHMLPECQSTATLLSKLFCSDFVKTCDKCGDSVSSLTLHIVLYCSKNETLRQRLWSKIYEFCGHSTYRRFIQLDVRNQVTHLTFGLCHFIENDLDREKCLKFVVKKFSQYVKIKCVVHTRNVAGLWQLRNIKWTTCSKGI